eukprot:scaffold11875_cov132-Isochrysis_galbana.AAC.3
MSVKPSSSSLPLLAPLADMPMADDGVEPGLRSGLWAGDNVGALSACEYGAAQGAVTRELQPTSPSPQLADVSQPTVV